MFAWFVAQHPFEGRIGVYAAVPVMPSIDLDSRESRRQGTAGKDVLDANAFATRIEIADFATFDVDGANRNTYWGIVQVVEINQFLQRFAQRRQIIETSLSRRDRQTGDKAIAPAGRKKIRQAGHARGERIPLAGQRAVQGMLVGSAMIDQPALSDARPELIKMLHAALRPVAGDQCRIDGTDRCADHPVQVEFGVMHGLEHAGLERAEGASALKDQHGMLRYDWFFIVHVVFLH